MWAAVTAEVITQSTLAVGAFTVIASPEQALLMPIFFLAGRLAAVAFLLVTFIRTHGYPKLGIDLAFLKHLLGKAVPLCGSQVSAMIAANFDLVLIGLWLGSAGAGLYGAAAKIVFVPSTIAVAYATALRPLVAHAYVAGFGEIEDLFKRSVRIATAIAFGIATGGIILAGPIMSQLFGKTYAPAGTALALLLVGICMMIIRCNYRLVLVSFNHQVVDLRIMTAAAIVNILLNVWLIRPLGIAGAALATVASEGLILLCDYFCTRKLISHVPLGRYLWKPTICSLIMASVLFAAAPLASVWGKITIGATVYALLMLVFQIVTLDEIRSCINTFLPARIPVAVPNTSFSPSLNSADTEHSAAIGKES
jgi:O-antigen/teichoic acid export membrane protein